MKMLELLKLKVKGNKPGVITNKGDYIGSTRHFPPASQEWFNSIYAYNKNTLQLLPVADNVVIKLIRSYFYMFNRRLEKKIKSPRLRIWMRRLSTRKILVSKPELKHTSDKVIITLYIYNRNYNYYLNKLIKITTLGYYSTFKKFTTEYARLIVVDKGLAKFQFLIKLLKLKGSMIISKVKEETKLLARTLNWKDNNLVNYENSFYLDFMRKSLRKEITYMYFKQIMLFNKFKFRDTLILPLKILIRKIYGKDVEFNLITLKNFHLNSDIFAQVITLKTSNRKNRVLKVLKSSLRKIKIPRLNKVLLAREPTVLTGIQNIILNDTIPNNLNTNSLEARDSLNIILNNKFKSLDLQNTILNPLKYKNIGGVRIEAAGRLTKRITAAKTIFKLKYVGTLKNLDSSYRGLPSVILKGNQKSNIQFTQLKSKTRIGAFGIKGWVSGH